jgi:hypothetical protein
MFPFSTKYSTDVAIKSGEEERARVLQYIREYLLQKSTKNIEINHDRLSFKALGGSNWNIMSTIEKGTFELKNWDGYLVITYEFFMYQLFIIAPVMSVFMGVVSQSWSFGIFAFCGLFGVNWIIALLRHKAMFDEDYQLYIRI